LLLRSTKTTPIERAVVALRSLVLESVPEVAECASAEVWAHARPRDGHHQLHWDLDERRLRTTHTAASPVASSVLYLSATGPPTLVVDHAWRCRRPRNRGWLCCPRSNRLLTFDGRLLHGVLPAIASRHGSESVSRVTLMVGWWRPGVELSPSPAASPPSDDDVLFTPAPNIPFDPRRQPFWTPPPGRSVEGSAALHYSDETDANKAFFGPVAPVWRSVDAGDLDDRACGAFACADVRFVGRFFLEAGLVDGRVPAATLEHDVLSSTTSSGAPTMPDPSTSSESQEAEFVDLAEARRVAAEQKMKKQPGRNGRLR